MQCCNIKRKEMVAAVGDIFVENIKHSKKLCFEKVKGFGC